MWSGHRVTRLSAYPDLSEAHRQHGALREVVIHHPGGWPDTAALAKVREDKTREAVRLAVRRCATLWTGKKPLVEVMLLQVAQ